MPRYGQYSVFDFLVQSNLSCGLGYSVDKFHRHGRFEEMHPTLRLDADADGLGVGITVLTLNSHGGGDQLVGIVKPLVKIHLVSVDTGYYIKSRSFPAAVPVTTTPCALLDATTSPAWHQELVLNAYFSDVVAEDTLLLFEVLDDKPSLRTNYNSSSSLQAAPIAKRVAWGYLLPIGMSGEMNVGFSEDWKLSARQDLDRQQRRLARRKAKRSKERNGGDGGSSNAGDDQSVSSRHSRVSGASAGRAAGGEEQHPNNSEEDDDSADEGENASSAGAGAAGAGAGIDISTTEGEEAATEAAVKVVRSKYPWHKPSVDKHARIQLHYYREYDGVLGMIQRKIKGWPTIGSYTDK